MFESNGRVKENGNEANVGDNGEDGAHHGFHGKCSMRRSFYFPLLSFRSWMLTKLPYRSRCETLSSSTLSLHPSQFASIYELENVWRRFVAPPFPSLPFSFFLIGSIYKPSKEICWKFCFWIKYMYIFFIIFIKYIFHIKISKLKKEKSVALEICKKLNIIIKWDLLRALFLNKIYVYFSLYILNIKLVN